MLQFLYVIIIFVFKALIGGFYMSNVDKIISLVVVLVVFLFGWKYYTDNYQSHTAYAIVPKTVPEKVKTVSDSGKKFPNSYSYEYNFNFVLENGKTREIKFDLIGKDPKPFTPDAVVKADISKKFVIKGPSSVNEENVPKKVKNVLNIN